MGGDARPAPEDRAPAADLRGGHRARLRAAGPALRRLTAATGAAALLVWLDGRLLAPGELALPADDEAYLHGRGCYATARVQQGRLRHGARHARRLVRDARVLGLGELDAAHCVAALEELARAAFAGGDGIVRLQASRGGDGRLRLVGLARTPGPEPATWRAATAPFAHEGPSPFPGVKLSGHPRIALARDLARRAGADEAVLCDAAGHLVEGARTNLFVVLADGRLVTPRIESGAVAGVGREILLERVADVGQEDVPRAALAAAHELVAVSSARGARVVTHLDGAPVADGRPGPWAARLDAILAAGE